MSNVRDSLVLFLVEIGQGCLEGQLVTDGTQAADNTDRDVGEIGFPAEILAGVDIGEMHLDEGDLHRQQGIAQGDTGVGKAGRVEDDEIDVFERRRMDMINQFMLAVGLEGHQLPTNSPDLATQAFIDRIQRHRPVMVRLAATQQVKIRPV